MIRSREKGGRRDVMKEWDSQMLRELELQRG